MVIGNSFFLTQLEGRVLHVNYWIFTLMHSCYYEVSISLMGTRLLLCSLKDESRCREGK